MDAILYCTVNVPGISFDDAAVLFQNGLSQEGGHTSLDHDHEPPRWGNAGGLTTLEKLDQTLSETQALKSKMSVVELKLTRADEEIMSLRKRVDMMATYVK